MAYMYPHTNTATSLGEQFMYDRFAEFLPSGFICYHNRVVGMLEFDFAIIVPGRGILICEVRGHKAKDIKRVEGQSYFLNDGAAVYSPYEQARKYRFIFASLIKDQMGKDVPIFTAVCYPFINESEFRKKELDKLSSREETILSDDINHSLTKRITDLLTHGRKRMSKQFSELTLNLILKIRAVFEPTEVIEQTIGTSDNKPDFVKREHYSCIAVLPKAYMEHNKKEATGLLIEQWRSGTKLCVITDDEDLLDEIRVDIDNFALMLDANSYHRFTLFGVDGRSKSNAFNLELYCYQKTDLAYSVEYDGVFSDATTKILKTLDAESSFNIKQYALEHSEVDRNIMVVAGAGTGKTTSMIARISYLIYKHNLNADSLPDALFMLTFTNEAAKNMKQKLKDYFQDYFLLTMDYEALRLSECVENMSIGTIHALSKRILEYYSVNFGLGKSLQIVSGKFEKDRFLTDSINAYIEDKKYDSGAFGLPMYELHGRLADIMTKLQNKNIDVNNDALDWGDAIESPVFHDIVKHVTEEAERTTRRHFDNFSKIRLSDLMIKMKELVRAHGSELRSEGFPIRYVFVDEFQDTDDVQIDLIKKFQAVFGFSLFVVGDIKQCIYRFRGANDKAFDVLVPASEKSNWMTFELNKNYRTDKFLLESFNTRFSRWGQHGLLEYKDSDRLVGVRSFNEGKSEDSFYYSESKWNESKSKNKSSMEERLVKILMRLHKEPAKNPSEQIAILVRENWQVEKVKEICVNANINVETDVGGELYQLQPVIDLYKMVKALQHYKTPKYLFNLYTTYFIDAPMPKEVIFQTRFSSDAMVRLYALFNTKLMPIPKWEKYVEALKYEPVLKILREIVLDLKPWLNRAENEITQENKKRAATFYRQNLDVIFEKLAFDFNSDYLTISRIERFLEIMIQTGQKEQSREPFGFEQVGKIVCMTVHKAKGLEYHTVILPYMAIVSEGKKHKGNTDIIALGNRVGYSVKTDKYNTITNSHYQAFKAEEAADRRDEEARILYVAMTRAKQRFIYFDDMKNSGTIAKPKDWKILLRGDVGL